MEYKDILYTRENGVATITLNRPDKRNSFSPDMVTSILQAGTEAAADKEVKVLLVTGAGPAFCAGGDVKAMADFANPQRDPNARDAVAEGSPLYRLLHHFPKPTVAAINGVCVGGGFELALACDIRIASDKARFSEAFIRRGMIPMGSGTFMLPRLIGIDKAFLLILTGDMIDAREAERIGLVTRVVPHDELQATVTELTEKLSKAAPLAVRAVKQAIYRGLDSSLDEALDWVVDQNKELAKTGDHEEGSRAFVEKREPFFKGK
jgi:enoyl-CoA hydratase/carnithine racemase